MTQNSEHFRIFQSHMRHKRSEHTIKNMLKNTDCNVQARRKQHVMAKNGPIVYYGTSPFLMGKFTISMAIFNSKTLNYQRVAARKCSFNGFKEC